MEQELAAALAARFETDKFNVKADPHRDTLYIEIHGLENFSENDIEKLAGPILSETDSEYEEIILLPLP